jgi:hypothetical protein
MAHSAAIPATPPEDRVKPWTAISSHSFNAMCRRVDAWLSSGYVTASQVRDLCDYLTIALDTEGDVA